MDLEGQISLSRYFADVTMKKQIAVTALLECEVIVVDFVLVSRFAFQIIGWLLT